MPTYYKALVSFVEWFSGSLTAELFVPSKMFIGGENFSLGGGGAVFFFLNADLCFYIVIKDDWYWEVNKVDRHVQCNALQCEV